MVSLQRKALTPLVALALVAIAGQAHAERPDEPVPVPVRAAPDDLSGHFVLAPRLAYLVPMGSAEKGFTQRGFTGSGPSFGLDLAIGISRYVAISARGDYGMMSTGDRCPVGGTCKATSTAFGLGVDYHLVNGAPFDPWMRAGIGYRIMQYDLSWTGYDPGKLDYSGFDWIHLAVGGDWYAHELLGFGPYFAFDLGSYSSRPSNDTARPASTARGGAIHSFLSVGLRGVFDPMR